MPQRRAHATWSLRKSQRLSAPAESLLRFPRSVRSGRSGGRSRSHRWCTPSFWNDKIIIDHCREMCICVNVQLKIINWKRWRRVFCILDISFAYVWCLFHVLSTIMLGIGFAHPANAIEQFQNKTSLQHIYTRAHRRTNTHTRTRVGISLWLKFAHTHSKTYTCITHV